LFCKEKDFRIENPFNLILYLKGQPGEWTPADSNIKNVIISLLEGEV